MSDTGLTNVGTGWNVTFTPAAGTSNHCLVSIQVKDADGNALTEPVALKVYLSDAETGIGITNTAISGSALAVGTSGTLLGTGTAKKCIDVLTDATGLVIIDIEDTAKTPFYVCAVVPNQPGRIAVSDVLATADYA